MISNNYMLFGKRKGLFKHENISPFEQNVQYFDVKRQN
jgi:hypothetical protein